jgi:integral membrane sensor domain MASE1
VSSSTASSTAAPAGSRPAPRLRLPHTRDEVLAATTVVLAAVALLLTLAERYDLGAVVSLGAVLLGGTSQLVSQTRFERWESVCATVLAAVLLAVCLANGSGVFTTTAVIDP